MFGFLVELASGVLCCAALVVTSRWSLSTLEFVEVVSYVKAPDGFVASVFNIDPQGPIRTKVSIFMSHNLKQMSNIF